MYYSMREEKILDFFYCLAFKGTFQLHELHYSALREMHEKYHHAQFQCFFIIKGRLYLIKLTFTV